MVVWLISSSISAFWTSSVYNGVQYRAGNGAYGYSVLACGSSEYFGMQVSALFRVQRHFEYFLEGYSVESTTGSAHGVIGSVFRVVHRIYCPWSSVWWFDGIVFSAVLFHRACSVLFRPYGPFHRFCPVLCELTSRHLFCSLFLCLRVHFIRLIASVSLVAGPLTGSGFLCVPFCVWVNSRRLFCSWGCRFPCCDFGSFLLGLFPVFCSLPPGLSCSVFGPFHTACSGFAPVWVRVAHNTFLLGLLDWFQFSPGFCPGFFWGRGGLVTVLVMLVPVAFL